MMLAQAYRALGDPVRLKMVERLSGSSTHTLGTVSKGLGVTRQGARKHLLVLEEAKLVRLVAEGRETRVQLNVSTLDKARAFITKLERQWDKRLEALRDFSEKG
jgi:DNA-binding transcriptional ArsR family regulator